MLMNGKIIFDRYYSINSAETKEISCRNKRNMVHYILKPRHIFIRVKAFVGRTSVRAFARRPATSIRKSHVLTARARGNLNINARLSLSLINGC